jgi:hypothetical protein
MFFVVVEDFWMQNAPGWGAETEVSWAEIEVPLPPPVVPRQPKPVLANPSNRRIRAYRTRLQRRKPIIVRSKVTPLQTFRTQDIRVTGQLTDTKTQDLRITGQQTDTKTQDLRITAQATDFRTQDFRITGFVPRPSTVLVHTASRRPYGRVRQRRRPIILRSTVTPKQTFRTQDVRITGQDTSSSTGSILTLTDTFTRSVSGGFGTADSGQIWSGGDAKTSVDGVRAVQGPYTTQTGGPFLTLPLGLRNLELTGIVSWDTLATGNLNRHYFLLRHGGDGLSIVASIEDNSNANIRLNVSDSAGNPTGTGDVLSGLTAGRKIAFRLRLVGSHFQMRAWYDGTAEPSTWSLDLTLTTDQTTGTELVWQAGRSSTNTTTTFYIDELYGFSIGPYGTSLRVTGQDTSSTTTNFRIVGDFIEPTKPIIHRASRRPYLAARGRRRPIITRSKAFPKQTFRTQDLRVQGQLTDSITQDLRITGQNTDARTQDFRITGFVPRPSLVLVHPASRRSWQVRRLRRPPIIVRAKVTPKSISRTQDLRITGQLTDSKTQDLRVTAQATDFRTQDFRITAQNSDARTQDFRVSGSLGDSVARDFRLTSQATDTVTRDLRVTGGISDSTTRDLRVVGQTTNSDTLDFRITGQLTNFRTQDLRISGSLGDAVTRDFRVTAQTSIFTTQDFRVVGQLTNTVTRDLRVTGQATDSRTQDFRVAGQLTSNRTLDLRVVGSDTTSITRDLRVTGQLTSSTTLDWRIVGQTDTFTTRDLRVTGELSSSVTQAFSVQGGTLSFDNVTLDFRIEGTLLSTSSRTQGFTIVGQSRRPSVTHGHGGIRTGSGGNVRSVRTTGGLRNLVDR